MQKVLRSQQARRELDRKFASADLSPIRAMPRKGWIRAVRGALGMTQSDLAGRLAISRVAVDKLERAELSGGITLAKLNQVARALDCSVVYALLPNSSLEETVKNQALSAARANAEYTSRTMALEAQSVDDDWKVEAVERQAEELIAAGRVWK